MKFTIDLSDLKSMAQRHGIEPDTHLELIRYTRYRITIRIDGSPYEGQFIFDDHNGLIDLDVWNEWGCHSPFHDCILESVFGSNELSGIVTHIEVLETDLVTFR